MIKIGNHATIEKHEWGWKVRYFRPKKKTAKNPSPQGLSQTMPLYFARLENALDAIMDKRLPDSEDISRILYAIKNVRVEMNQSLLERVHDLEIENRELKFQLDSMKDECEELL